MVCWVPEFANENFLFINHTDNFVMFWNQNEMNVVN
jgi:hypothetical protein